MKTTILILLAILTAIHAPAQSSNITVTVSLDTKHLAALDACVAESNASRTNAVPALPALTQVEFLQLSLAGTLRDLVQKNDDTVRATLLAAFTNAPPEKRQAALDALKEAKAKAK